MICSCVRSESNIYRSNPFLLQHAVSNLIVPATRFSQLFAPTTTIQREVSN